jgi:translation initiation factor IF-2
MTDTKDADNSGRRPLSLSGRKTDSGVVKQSFSHGRSKSVVVETKKKKVVVTPGAQPKVVRPEPEKPAASAAPAKPLTAAEEALQKSNLSQAELKARQAALQMRRAEEERRKAEQEQADEQARRLEEARRLKAEEEKRRAEAPPVDSDDDDEGGRRGGRDFQRRAEASPRPRPDGPVRVSPTGATVRPAGERPRFTPGGPGAGDRGPRPAPGGAARPGFGADRGGPPRPRPLTPLEPEEFNPLGDLGGRVKRVKAAGEEASG